MGEYIKFLTGHHRRRSPVVYIVDEETGCWNWQLSLDRKGYGTVCIKGKKTAAHRFIYEQEHGPIPGGMVLDHLCRNPKCVNPAHLEPVTQAENVQRGNHAKLTQADVNEIRRLWATGSVTQKELGHRFGVAPAYISQLVNYSTWKQLP